METPRRGLKGDAGGLGGASGPPGSHDSPRGFRRIGESFRYAWSGLSYVYMTQPNMRIHVLAASLAGGACIVAGVGAVEILMVTSAIAGVLAAEVVNTVAESLTDLLEPRESPIAKVIKDVAAAGVLLTAGFSVVIALIVFVPALLDFRRTVSDFLAFRALHFGLYTAFVLFPAVYGLTLPQRPGARNR